MTTVQELQDYLSMLDPNTNLVFRASVEVGCDDIHTCEYSDLQLTAQEQEYTYLDEPMDEDYIVIPGPVLIIHCQGPSHN